MKFEWKKYQLSELLELIIDHRGKTPKKLGFKDFHSSGSPVLSAKHVKTTGLVNIEGIRFANDEMYEKWMKVEVEEGDIVLTSEAPMGELFYIDGKTKYVLGQRVFGLRPKKELIHPHYLFAWFASKRGQDALSARATGSTVLGIKQSELVQIEIDVPPMEYQEIIAQNLFMLSDKIALNTQINQTLEAMAQALFKSWFVDFDPVKAKMEARASGGSDDAVRRAAMAVISGKSEEELVQFEQENPDAFGQLAATADLFPEALVESELGLIPEGWGVKTAEQLFDISIGKTPPRKEPKWFSFDNCNVKWLSIRDMGENTVFSKDTSEYLTAESISKFNIKVMPKNTIFLSFKLTVGRVSIANDNICTNEAIAHFPPNGDIPWGWLYLYLKTFDYSQLGSTSSIATAVNSKTIKSMPILEASMKVLVSFENLTTAVFEQIRNQEIQNSELAQTRDTLLPKLLSGEIDLSSFGDRGVGE